MHCTVALMVHDTGVEYGYVAEIDNEEVDFFGTLVQVVVNA